MYSQGRRSSDVESMSSDLSDVTSRVTTQADSWSETDLHHNQNQNRLNIPTTIHGAESSGISATTNTSVDTVINRKPEMSRTNNNQLNGGATQNQNQQQAWTNPYWSANKKSNTGITPPGPSDNRSSSTTNVQQLIPGSILINDRGEIANQSSKQNTRPNSITSDNSFNPGGKYVADGSGGSGGYLAPTHTQREDATSSSESTKHQQQDFPKSTDKDNKSWANPYWDTKNPQKPTTSSESWKNPYWDKKNPQQPTASIESWKNPYWDTKSPQKPTSSSESSKNPYWDTNDSQKPTSLTESWNNSYWDDKDISNTGANGTILNNAYTFDNSSPSEHKTIPVPSFYERIYPPQMPSSSSGPIVNTNHETILASEPVKQNVYDDQDLPYTIDSQSVAHYRGPSSSSDAANKTAPLAPQSITSQYPVLPPQTTNTAQPSQIPNNAPPPQTTSALSGLFSSNNAPPPQKTNALSGLFPSNNAPPAPSTNSNTYASSLYSHYPSLNPSASMATFTQEELDSIHDALHLLETNPNAIPLVQAPAQIFTSNTGPGTDAASHIASFFTSNRNQPSQSQPPSSSFLQNFSNNPPSSFNPQRQPASSTLIQNIPNNPPSNINPPPQPPSSSILQNVFNNPSSHINPQPQPPASSALPNASNNPPSNINPPVQPPAASFLQNVSTNPPSNSYPQQTPLFSTPSYPSNSDELLRRSTKLGAIVLV